MIVCVCLSVSVCPCLMAQPLISTGLSLFPRFTDSFLHSHHSFSSLLKPVMYIQYFRQSQGLMASLDCVCKCVLTVCEHARKRKISGGECVCMSKLVCLTPCFTVGVFIYRECCCVFSCGGQCVCLPHNYDITASHASLDASAHHNISIIILSLSARLSVKQTNTQTEVKTVYNPLYRHININKMEITHMCYKFLHFFLHVPILLYIVQIFDCCKDVLISLFTFLSLLLLILMLLLTHPLNTSFFFLHTTL